MKIFTKRVFPILSAVLIFIAVGLSGCNSKSSVSECGVREQINVTVFDGEHYRVTDGNKKTVVRGKDVSFNISVEEGFELVSSFGDECEITQFKTNPSFVQTVTFYEVIYDTNVTLSVRELDVTDFKVLSNIAACTVEINSAAGQPSEDKLYADDTVTLYAVPAAGYRFYCWSTENYLAAGGKYYSNDRILKDFDFNSFDTLYANFKSTDDSARTIVYDFGENVKIEQDCSSIIAHHYRANTLTERDLADIGFEVPQNKMLVGWQTKSGEYVGLGSRTEVSEEKYITLTPVWKDYSPEEDFLIDKGKIISYLGNSSEVVIPKSIGDEEVIGIGTNAFEGCEATTYYLPSTITNVEANAFLNCTALKDFYMSDNIMNISDESFKGCKNFTSLYLNAYYKPRYMTNYIAGKTEVYERMASSDPNRKKLILLGGSSVRYGYNTDVINGILDNGFDVYNLGLNASAGGFAQLELIFPYLRKDDVLLHAPELRETAWSAEQVRSGLTDKNECSITSPSNQIFVLCESDWGLLSHLTVNRYGNFFNNFHDFNSIRKTMKEQNYYDFFPTTNNINGINSYTEYYYAESGKSEPYNLEPFLFDSIMTKRAINLASELMYVPLIDLGVKIFVTFAPLSRQQLYKTYENEENLRTNALKYTDSVKEQLTGLNISILLTQYDTVYDCWHFADSDYHLGSPTRDNHTTKVINALYEALSL